MICDETDAHDKVLVIVLLYKGRKSRKRRQLTG